MDDLSILRVPYIKNHANYAMKEYRCPACETARMLLDPDDGELI